MQDENAQHRESLSPSPLAPRHTANQLWAWPNAFPAPHPRVVHAYSDSLQENLSDNSVVILYDPVQTANGQLMIKAYRLSKAFMRVYREKKNEVIKPSEILEELPIKIRNPGIINALVFDLQVLTFPSLCVTTCSNTRVRRCIQ